MNIQAKINEYLKERVCGSDWVWTKPLEIQKQNAKECFKREKEIYLTNQTSAQWERVCVCKAWCAMLGVIL